MLRNFLGDVALFCILLSAGAALPGCAEKKRGPEENKAADHLRKIAQAFDIAQYKTGRPPKDADELKPVLKELSKDENPDDLLRSPNDQEAYQIAWGVNLDRQTDTDLIFAHEKKGVEGKRYVITVARIVMQKTDAEFEAAKFAKSKR